MKTIFKFLAFSLFVLTVIPSCKDNDFDFEAEKERALQAEKKLDSLFTAERTKIEEYVEDNFTTDEPIEDTVVVAYQYLEKKIKRGIWYEILQPATNDSYEYKVTSNGYYFVPVYPTNLKLKFTVKLLDGTVVQADETGGNYNINTMGSSPLLNEIWKITFIPYSVKQNGNDIPILGITKEGLQVGNKIRLITPSYWAFGSQAKEVSSQTKVKIPADSPLVYEFEVLGIE